MLSINASATIEDAGRELLPFILEPRHWVQLDRLSHEPQLRPGTNPAYQRQVGALRICASVDVTQDLGVFLRIAFRAPSLSPTKAADHLEQFLGKKLPLTPNSEWQVQIDERRWIHFIRRYAAPMLSA